MSRSLRSLANYIYIYRHQADHFTQLACVPGKNAFIRPLDQCQLNHFLPPDKKMSNQADKIIEVSSSKHLAKSQQKSKLCSNLSNGFSGCDENVEQKAEMAAKQYLGAITLFEVTYTGII